MDLIHADAIVTARPRTAGPACSARPDAPTIPEPDRPARNAGEPAATVRHRASLALRRLADRLDPMPAGHSPRPGGAS